MAIFLHSATNKLKTIWLKRPETLFLHSNLRLGYGVMVTQQILILSFKVRILVTQQKSPGNRGFFSLFN
jgi:hypothetical protein